MKKNCEDCVHAMRTVDDFPCCDCHRYEMFEDANGIPQPSKTLLDEFAMAAMAAIVGKRPYMTVCGEDDLETARTIIAADCRGAYETAAAMMKERERRDEMGNVKEVEK